MLEWLLSKIGLWGKSENAPNGVIDGPAISTVGRFSWNGYNKMPVKDSVQLNDAQDIVFANKSYWPSEDGDTFCNLATQDVLNRLGYNALSGMTADVMHETVSISKDWTEKQIGDVQALANAGTIVLAILPSFKLAQSHGHVCTLTAGVGTWSGHWNVMAPMALNLGRIGTCFRKIGVNYAFVPIPEFYALVATL